MWNIGGVPSGRCAKQALRKNLANSCAGLHLEMDQHLKVFSTSLPGGYCSSSVIAGRRNVGPLNCMVGYGGEGLRRLRCVLEKKEKRQWDAV
jgi:hypothetical protein